MAKQVLFVLVPTLSAPTEVLSRRSCDFNHGLGPQKIFPILKLGRKLFKPEDWFSGAVWRRHFTLLPEADGSKIRWRKFSRLPKEHFLPVEMRPPRGELLPQIAQARPFVVSSDSFGWIKTSASCVAEKSSAARLAYLEQDGVFVFEHRRCDCLQLSANFKRKSFSGHRGPDGYNASRILADIVGGTGNKCKDPYLLSMNTKGSASLSQDA